MRLSCLLPFCLAIVATSHAADHPCRWVYVSRGLDKDQDVEDIRAAVTGTAARWCLARGRSPGSVPARGTAGPVADADRGRVLWQKPGASAVNRTIRHPRYTE